MNAGRMYLEGLEGRARKRLPPDFARRVLEDARVRQRRRRMGRTIAATAAICLGLTVAIHLMRSALTERQNLEQWARAIKQIATVEESI